MGSIRVDAAGMEWGSAVRFYGPGARHDGRDVIQLKLLSDRRAAGGGIAWLLRVEPPPGKMIKIIATARSDEHVFGIEGGRVTKSGAPARGGGYTLNPAGQPHSAFIAQPTVSLVIYNGEPDEIHALDIVDADPAA
jgi:hypothetical protein